MNLIAFLSTIALTIYLCMGVFVLWVNRRSTHNRLFFLVCLLLSLWTLSAIFAYGAETKDTFLAWFRIGSIPNMFFYPLSLHFCFAITGVVRLRPVIYMMIYGPVVPLIYHASTGTILFKDFIKIGGYWDFIPDYGSPWLAYNVLYYFVCIFIGAVCFIFWSRNAGTNKEKRQGRVISSAMLISLVLITFDEIILSKFTWYNTKAMSPVLFIFWMGGVWYAIVRYQFMSITSAVVSECIMANIDESFILLDREFRIVRTNHVTEQILDMDRKMLNKRHVSDIIEEGDAILSEMKRISNRELSDFSCRLHYRRDGGGSVFMDAKLKMVMDRYDDFIGILIIGRDMKELNRFREHFNITVREADVIRHVIQGRSRIDIAGLLGISPETVKTHITSAYNKLGVSSKMQMLNILKEYNLVSERQSDATVVFFR